jgi:hypothetical protein
MEVKKMGTIRIPPSYTEYYTLQRKYKTKCPNCKKSPLVFSEENRTLTVVCQTKACKSNMEIVIPTYLTFDQLYTGQQEDFRNVTNHVLKEKFDLMFEYKKSTDLATLKNDYLQKKRAYEDTQRRHEEQSQEREKKKRELETQREVMIQALRQGKPIKEDLNAILNDIHRTSYIKIGQEPVLLPEFERDILSYAV